MKLKETVTAPIAVLCTYGLYYACFRTPVVTQALAEYGDYSLISGIVLVLLCTLMPALIYAKCRGVGYSVRMHFLELRPSRSIFALCALIFALCGAVLFCMGSSGIFGCAKFSFVDTYALSLSARELPVILRCVGCALIPAAAEEFLYRGVVFCEFRQSGFLPALLFSSLFFALGQFSLVRLPVFFFLGCVMGVIYYVSDSLPLTVLCRMVFNLLAFYFEDAAWTLILKRSNFVFFVCFCTVMALLAASLALSEAQRIFYTKGLDGEPTPAEAKDAPPLGVRLLTALASPTVLLCIAVAFAIILFG